MTIKSRKIQDHAEDLEEALAIMNKGRNEAQTREVYIWDQRLENFGSKWFLKEGLRHPYKEK